MATVEFKGAYSIAPAHIPEVNLPAQVVDFDKAKYPINALASNVVNRVPVPVIHKQITLFRGHSFSADYYERIHITPSHLDLGNILSSQSRNVDVWNAFTTPKTLQSITEVGTDGITLTAPVAPPTIFQGLENRRYVAAISTNGPPVINAKYTFNFQGAPASLTITGRRVVVWPYIIQTQHSETLEWLTEVLETYEGEQRLAMRKAPRQTYDYTHVMSDHDMSTAYVLLEEWFQRVFGVPVWNELALVGAITGKPQFIDTRTDIFDYRANDVVLVWESPEKYEAVETTTITATRINLKIPLANDYQHAYIMPLRFGRMLSPPSFDRTAMGVTKGQASFTVLAMADLGQTNMPTYKGLDVYMRPLPLRGGNKQTVFRDVEVIDSLTGEMTVSSVKAFAQKTQPLTISLDDRADLWVMRRWLHHKRGKQRPFFLPTWNQDFTVKLNVAENAQSLTVRNTNYHLYSRQRDLMLKLKNGNVYYRRITGAALLPSGDESISIDSAFGVSFTPDDVEVCCFLNVVRFNSDRIELSHNIGGVTNITIPTMGVGLNESS